MAYSELIKNFDKIRSYMSDFFIYGFKTRDEYDKKSARSYDNERRRIQSYLGNLVSFKQTSAGKNMFISLEGRSVTHNPLYQAFKSKSFTNKDITMHFIVMDILADGEKYTLKELCEIFEEEYLYCFDEPMNFDESTLRKKLKEYENLGIIVSEKEGKIVSYRRANDNINIIKYKDAIRFFTEENPIVVVESYLEDKMGAGDEYLLFKNHYIMNAYDTEIIAAILQGIHEKRIIEISNFGRKSKTEKKWHVVPMKLYVSTQGGRNYLLCMGTNNGKLSSFRVDYIQKVKLENVCNNYEKLYARFENVSKHMWGVIHNNGKNLEHIELDIHVGLNEEHIIRRLNREKRCGSIEKIEDETYRFVADVYDVYEMIPWIRTFFGRIKSVKCDNVEAVNQLKYDIVKMTKQYEECDDF